MEKVKYINNLKDLDIEIAKADNKAKISDDQLRQALSEFCYVVDYPLPKDPYSQEYYEAQMQLYLNISGRNKYTIANEHSPFDFEAIKNNPFPYFTKSSNTVGEQLIAQGFLIKTMNLAADSKVVEFGPGWGNTTLHLAQMGYKVTAVDCEESFLNLIRYRTQNLPNQVETLYQDMLDFTSNVKYDAAVFFECFHHCANHLQLLRNLHNIITDEGLIAFAAEPISDFPYPWGLRLDGMSVWSIRKFGWLELGFEPSYFLRTLLMLGWTPKRYRSDISPLANVIIASKSQMYYEPSEITLPPDECRTWATKETDPNLKLRFTHTKSVMTCAQNIDAKFIEFCISNYAPFDIDANINTGDSAQSIRVKKSSEKGLYKISIQKWSGKFTISSKVWKPAQVFHNGDNRELGLGIHYVRFVS
ncbi:SAM-dependent methyltransferase [Halotia branconii]|uniref:Class I SAM-dependent methyltransferase n=1 Tax=Halotia branconii CENA392 TaxID=1539056 RepID=A0AAJ6P9B3_9CYAN|nr:class I SAM-dependent methyltransferase [Halotia branconii]WGV25486.1 class I SAM-dependent methyltransferase [Halotia branconii CENA392]